MPKPPVRVLKRRTPSASLRRTRAATRRGCPRVRPAERTGHPGCRGGPRWLTSARIGCLAILASGAFSGCGVARPQRTRRSRQRRWRNDGMIFDPAVGQSGFVSSDGLPPVTEGLLTDATALVRPTRTRQARRNAGTASTRRCSHSSRCRSSLMKMLRMWASTVFPLTCSSAESALLVNPWPSG